MYENHTIMEALTAETIEAEVISIIKEICEELSIDVDVDKDFTPGDLIKSHVLLDTISTISDAIGIQIPNDCYIFCDKYNRQFTIEEAVEKIIKTSKNGK